MHHGTKTTIKKRSGTRSDALTKFLLLVIVAQRQHIKTFVCALQILTHLATEDIEKTEDTMYDNTLVDISFFRFSPCEELAIQIIWGWGSVVHGQVVDGGIDRDYTSNPTIIRVFSIP